MSLGHNTARIEAALARELDPTQLDAADTVQRIAEAMRQQPADVPRRRGIVAGIRDGVDSVSAPDPSRDLSMGRSDSLSC